MALIGLLLIAAAAAVGIDIAAQNQFGIDIEAFNQVIATNASVVFIAGAVAGMAGALGVLLLVDGMARRRRLRAEKNEAIRERDRLASAYEAEHAEDRRSETVDSTDESLDLRERERARVRDRDGDREHITTF
jgi:flagellar biosynthesis/type III secretory pathway M-ring protein FliF/YscJ